MDELQQLPEDSDLQPQELLSEFRALQMMALYNGRQGSGDATDLDVIAAADAGLAVGKGQIMKKKFDEKMEEFLLQQVWPEARRCRCLDSS